MMLIICEINPEDNVNYLINNTNKNFVFKNLLELCQLLAGCEITNEMKPIKQGKEIMLWIKQNPCWVYLYFQELYMWCCEHINMKPETRVKFYNIKEDLLDYAFIHKLKYGEKPITHAVFRYKKEYNSEHASNTLLPIEEACFQYKKYIETYKFPKQNS